MRTPYSRFILLLMLLPMLHVDADDSLRVYLDGLRSGDPGVRMNAAIQVGTLGAKGRSAAPYLLRLLEDPDANVRQVSIQALASVDPESDATIRAVAAALKDPTSGVREAALGALGEGGHASAIVVGRIVGCFDDPDYQVRQEAVRAIGLIGPLAKDALPALLTALGRSTVATSEVLKSIHLVVPRYERDLSEESDVSAGLESRESARHTCAQVAPAMLTLLREPMSKHGRACLSILADCTGDVSGKLKADIAHALEPWLQAPDEDVRYVGIEVVARYGQPAAAQRHLRRLLLESEDHLVRGHALSALTGIQTDAVLLETALRALGDPAASVRAEALRVLRLRGGVDAIPAAQRAIEDPSEDVRAEAVTLLGWAGGLDSDTLVTLATAANDATPGVRREAVKAMARLLKKHQESETPADGSLAKAIDVAEKAVIRAVGDEFLVVRGEAVAGLLELAPVEAHAIDALIGAARDVAGRIRRDAVQALGESGSRARSALPVLLEATEDWDPQVRLQAVLALRYVHSDPESAVKVLRKALRTALNEPAGSEELLRATIQAAASYREEAASMAEDLIAASLSAHEPEVTEAATRALVEIGAPALPAIEKALTEARKTGREPSDEQESPLAELIRMSRDAQAATLEAAKREVNAATGAPPTLHVLDASRMPIELALSSRRWAFAVATWCPVSERFLRLLRDPLFRMFSEGIDLVLVLGDEWPRVEASLRDECEQNGTSEAEAAKALETLKRRSGDELLYDPTFLEDAPPPAYVFVRPGAPIGVEAFPAAYSPESASFSEDAVSWIEQNVRIPARVLSRLTQKHDLRRSLF